VLSWLVPFSCFLCAGRNCPNQIIAHSASGATVHLYSTLKIFAPEPRFAWHGVNVLTYVRKKATTEVTRCAQYCAHTRCRSCALTGRKVAAILRPSLAALAQQVVAPLARRPDEGRQSYT
jgi:hypothetical protein